ncbi:hypothetical protein [Marinimicrococcus flavescens]|uniref:Uncharacterized protein n=1 Tax=Marinimicrococcus flavescens TaxID=3031815 RepID=A0AAP3UYW0_9PROT|nr:hypothetical protein [Marinimicrococcus flavescens]
MSSLKRRLLFSLSAAALAVPVPAGGAQALEIVVLDQVNEAAQGAELGFEGITGKSLAATAAAIGNSAAFNVEGEGDAAALALEQVSRGTDTPGAQVADIHLDEVDLASGAAAGLSLTAAAIGNTLSGTGEGGIGALDLSQENGWTEDTLEGQYAHIVLDEVVVGGLESSLSAAALGNSASLTAGAIGTGDAYDAVLQTNDAAQFASIGIDDLVIRPTGSGAAFDATAAAIGNSLTLDAATGDLHLDTVVQENVGGDSHGGIDWAGYGQMAQVEILGINDIVAPSRPVGVGAESFETFDSTIVSAAIGNSGSLSAGGRILLDQVVQTNTTWQQADIDIAFAYGAGDLKATGVAIGNSMSISSGADLAFDGSESGLSQLNGWDQTAGIELSSIGAAGDLGLTAAAIGNSLSMSAEGGFAVGEQSGILQSNTDYQDASIELFEINGLTNLSATVVAMGNSMSLTTGGDLALGAYASIEQHNLGDQDATLGLFELNGKGSAGITIAAIGNSLSVSGEGAMAGLGGGIVQRNEGAQAVVLDLDGTLGSFGSANVTAVAIGNSLSLTTGAFDGAGTLSITQENLVPQSVSLGVVRAGLGAASTTTAAIGNSIAVTVR